MATSDFLNTKIEYIKGIGPKRAGLLNLELNIFTVLDLLTFYPFRYIDRNKWNKIRDISNTDEFYQIKGKIIHIENIKFGKKRFTAVLQDESGFIDLVWFAGMQWIEKKIIKGISYVIFGKPSQFKNSFSFNHPEFEMITQGYKLPSGLEPVYHSTDIIKSSYMDSKTIKTFIQNIFQSPHFIIEETLPVSIKDAYRLCNRIVALKQIHFPENLSELNDAKRRLKFEELFYIQLKILGLKDKYKKENKGQKFVQIRPRFINFYNEYLPFQLTNAQKRVTKEIREDLISGRQMNRLLQGDVGSGKTMVAFMAILIALDNDAQTCLIAPTEILAFQHFYNLKKFADPLNIKIELLTGSTKKKKRIEIHTGLESGDLGILVGTHALLEEKVKFKNLGLCIIDEQHRFGVAQRSRLWQKNDPPPHILVMTATPIPRTLAMTLYGDLDFSIIDEMPAGRKPIITTHRYESSREKVYAFVKQQILQGFQVYVVYPLIEESEKLDYKYLMDGVETIKHNFSQFQISVVHGKMKPNDKGSEMKRFVNKETQLMIATNVIEVGVDVSNATIMLIESAERFGLSQLHQLRGRVGRGSARSYCILMTGNKLSEDTRLRMDTLVSSQDGFKIADMDLKLRGPGELMGTQQSGMLQDLKLSNLSEDAPILKEARKCAQAILDKDPEFNLSENHCIKQKLASQNISSVKWGNIS